MLQRAKKRGRRLKVRIDLGVAALVVGFLTASPSLAIDGRHLTKAMVPIKGQTSPPDGAAGLCNSYVWACATSGRVLQIGDAEMRMIRSVNLRANRSIRSISDLEQYRTEELWALPTERGGDCEDYALAKKRALIGSGFPAEQLLVAALLDTKRQSHAVLVVRTGPVDLVLDNLTDQILPWYKTGYTFLRMQDPTNPRRWVSVMAGGIFAGS